MTCPVRVSQVAAAARPLNPTPRCANRPHRRRPRRRAVRCRNPTRKTLKPSHALLEMKSHRSDRKGGGGFGDQAGATASYQNCLPRCHPSRNSRKAHQGKPRQDEEGSRFGPLSALAYLCRQTLTAERTKITLSRGSRTAEGTRPRSRPPTKLPATEPAAIVSTKPRFLPRTTKLRSWL